MEETIQNQAVQPQNDYVETLSENTEPMGIAALKVTETMRQNLLSGLNWLKFLAILGVIGCVFMGLCGLVFSGVGVAMNAIPDLQTPVFSGWMFTFFGLIYLAILGAYMYPLKRTFNFISNTRNAMYGSQQGFEKAADDFSTVLKYTGIMIIVLFFVYILLVFGMVCFSIAMPGMLE